jgi:hypothetical protein
MVNSVLHSLLVIPHVQPAVFSIGLSITDGRIRLPGSPSYRPIPQDEETTVVRGETTI